MIRKFLFWVILLATTVSCGKVGIDDETSKIYSGKHPTSIESEADLSKKIGLICYEEGYSGFNLGLTWTTKGVFVRTQKVFYQSRGYGKCIK